MNVYTFVGFPGVYPTGTSAVVVAPDRSAACEILRNELIAKLPRTRHSEIVDWTIRTKQEDGNSNCRPVDTRTTSCRILNDGDY